MRPRAQMRAVAHLVGLVNPAGELVVKLAGRTDAELVNVQSSGIRAGPGDAGIVHAPLQVQVWRLAAIEVPGSAVDLDPGGKLHSCDGRAPARIEGAVMGRASGELARLSRLSPKALRLYDELGLLQR